MSLFSLSYLRAVAEPQTLLEEKEAIAEKLAISKYELRLAQEDISKLKIELQKKKEARSVVLSGNIYIYIYICTYVDICINLIAFDYFY